MSDQYQDEDYCRHCQAPVMWAAGYWHCPECDAEWPLDEDDDDEEHA